MLVDDRNCLLAGAQFDMTAEDVMEYCYKYSWSLPVPQPALVAGFFVFMWMSAFGTKQTFKKPAFKILSS